MVSEKKLIYYFGQYKDRKMNNYVFIGPPGSGKGTMAKKMVEEFGYLHLSTGDLIRNEQKKGTPLGKLANELIDQGNFLPDKVVIEMFQNFILDNPVDVGYIFDGFPRTPEQTKHFSAFLLKARIPFTAAVYFNLPPHISLERLLKRAEIENRKDDTRDVIEHRLRIYDSKTKPILKFFEDRGKLIQVDANGTVDEQYKRLKSALNL